MADDDVWRGAAVALLDELLDGASDECDVLNPGDRGLLTSLDGLTAAAASKMAPGGGASIAAHVDHLRYGLSLFNRWSGGEPNPFGDADWAASWRRTEVSEAEWAERRAALASEARRWAEALRTARAQSDVERRGILASVVHLAYHVGAIRQIDRAAAGPRQGE